MTRIEQSNSSGGVKTSTEENGEAGVSDSRGETVTVRRGLRSRYLAVKNFISDERDCISRPDYDKFKSIFNEVESLHQMVSKPREQVADAEALMDILSSVVISVKAHGNEGLTPADFITGLLGAYGQQGGASRGAEYGRDSVQWKDIGLAVSHIFKRVNGCCTMVGPMNTEIKRRKRTASRRKLERPTQSSRPEELDHSGTEGRSETDKNMATMFDILKKNRRVKLEIIILNRISFAETVENLFALSFLVKDGRAEITMDEKGCHLVSPRNAPSANAVVSGEVAYSHFIFRFDFKDWKLMTASVAVGEELMPQRNQVKISSDSKLSRNRALVLQEQMITEDSPEGYDSAASVAAIQNGKRKLSDEMGLL
ncbi:non-structural maintenance of chromosomes element 4 homolog B-like [Cornus florida]|uniref:non-structural maintenance of chromosomes element 4 homolog B-like n=1 Tax=Cornus florida TaxID=4283 RepID=UPI00289888C6|nr:non-structural maintenance of chromosomes element 4 homolog B-like [Cornus florida]